MSACFSELFRFSKSELDFVFKNKKVINKFRGLSVFSTDSDSGLLFGKFLIVISKKVGSACERNLLRRRLKHIFYTHKMFSKQAKTAVVCYPGATNQSFLDLTFCLNRHFAKVTLTIA